MTRKPKIKPNKDKDKLLYHLKNGTFMSKLSYEEFGDKLKKEAYTGILANDDTLFNPLDRVPAIATNHVAEYYAWLMAQPEYFYFLIKVLFNMNTFPMQLLLLNELYTHKFPMLLASRGGAKSSTLAMYILIRMITIPGRQCIITSAGFRQAKIVFEYMERIWKNSPMLQGCYPNSKSFSNGPTHGTDAWIFRLGESMCYALPVGPDGSKIRGYRANDLIVEEFASVNCPVFEEVMGPFLAVSANPIEQMQISANNKLMKRIGGKTIDQDETIITNQLVLCGTAYYKFNHFYRYYSKWKDIILSRGERKKLQEILGKDYSEDFNWKDYSIVRIPVDMLPIGQMDAPQIERIKASTTEDVYLREFCVIFTNDSDGFYRRSLINACTTSYNKPIYIKGEQVIFKPQLIGDPRKKYVFGVDPAYDGDNFAIVILECEGNTRKIVYVWTTQAKEHKKRLAEGIVSENDYYHYCVRKLRDLMKSFPCIAIALDSQGGGKSVMEAFRDTTKIMKDERMVLPAIDPLEKPKETDMMEGDHILYLINPHGTWGPEANHAMKKDMEDKSLLFPVHDDISYVEAEFYDAKLGDNMLLYDTLEDCVQEIEELKKELCNIVMTETATGKQRFDTPDVKLSTHGTGKLHKDRYSALLLANWVARNNEHLVPRFILSEDNLSGHIKQEKLFYGNNNIVEKLQNLYE